jgi:type IV secretory pathway VirB3-like protein
MERHEVINYTILWKPLAALGVPTDFLIVAMSLSGLMTVVFTIIVHGIMGYNSGGIFPFFAFFAALFAYGRIRAKDDPEFMTVYLTRFKYMKKTKGPDKGNVYYP